MDESKETVDDILNDVDTDQVATENASDNDDSLDSLLEELDNESDSDKASDEKEVSQEQKQINDLKAELGRLKKKEDPTEETKVDVKDEKKEDVEIDIKEEMAKDLLLQSNPNVKNILPTLEAHAKKLGTDVYTLFKTDSTYKTMADSFSKEEQQQETNINKINKPSAPVFTGKTLDNLTDEDMESMTSEQRLKVLTEMQNREG